MLAQRIVSALRRCLEQFAGLAKTRSLRLLALAKRIVSQCFVSVLFADALSSLPDLPRQEGSEGLA